MARRVNYEDLIIDLYIFNNLDRSAANMTTAKLIYLLEDNLFDKKIIGPHYVMFKLPMGPYNKKIATNIKNLSINGYLNYKDHYYEKIGEYVNTYRKNEITDKFLKSIEDLIEEYSKIFNILDDIIIEFGSLNSDQLKKLIYSLSKTGMEKKKIGEYEMYSQIINPLGIKNPKISFILDEDWYDTIEMLLNPELSIGIQKSVKSAQIGNLNHF